MAQILDLTQGILFDPFLLDSILARGYWEEYTGSRAELTDLLNQV